MWEVGGNAEPSIELQTMQCSGDRLPLDLGCWGSEMGVHSGITCSSLQGRGLVEAAGVAWVSQHLPVSPVSAMGHWMQGGGARVDGKAGSQVGSQ